MLFCFRCFSPAQRVSGCGRDCSSIFIAGPVQNTFGVSDAARGRLAAEVLEQAAGRRGEQVEGWPGLGHRRACRRREGRACPHRRRWAGIVVATSGRPLPPASVFSRSSGDSDVGDSVLGSGEKV